MTRPTQRWVRAERLHTLRPIEPCEEPHLDALGRVLRRLREDAGLSQAQTARRAGISAHHLAKLEAGARRTRATTLAALGLALAGNDWERGHAVATRLLAIAGPALAAPSEWEPVRKRRQTR